MEPHHISAAGTVASGAITATAVMADANWQTVAINAGITLISGLVSSWLKSRQPSKARTRGKEVKK